MKPLVIGSRGSQLALQQSRLVQALLQEKHPGLRVELEIIQTTGDRLSDASLSGLAESSKGLFVKEIEEALLRDHIDLAVHSLKDLPTALPQGLCLASTPQREDPHDGLVTASPAVRSVDDLPTGSRVGTSSPRRQLQLGQHRPDLEVVPIRGNLDTRIRKMENGDVAAIVLAVAGLKRLGWQQRITYTFPPEEMVPAVGQGALALEARVDDLWTRDLAQSIEHLPTRQCVEAERLFLERMGGGCQLPMGGHASTFEGRSRFWAFIGDPHSQRAIWRTVEGGLEDLDRLASATVDYLLAHGADEILRKIEAQPSP